MKYTKYPTIEDIKEFCEGLNIESPEKYPIESTIKSIVRKFERFTGWDKFLAPKETKTLCFNLETLSKNNGLIHLPIPLLEITEIRDNNNKTYYNLEDWDLYPENALENNIPYEWIKLNKKTFKGVRKLHITGIWGYSREVPEDVWMAILKKGSAEILHAMLISISKGLKSWKQFGVSEEYGGPFYADLFKQWNEDFNHTVQRYMRCSYSF